MQTFCFHIKIHHSFTALLLIRNHIFTTSHLTPVWLSIRLLKAHFLYYISYTAAGNKAPLTASYRFLCGCCWCVVHTAIMMSQTSISTKNFTTLLWAWLGNGSALYCKLLCWLGEPALWDGLAKELLVGWKLELPLELPAPGFRMLSLKVWVETNWEGAWGTGAIGNTDKSFKKKYS